jgi:hypothetical protein
LRLDFVVQEEVIALAVAAATIITLADIIAHKTREFLAVIGSRWSS